MVRTVVIACAAMLMIASVVAASPFLVCDPQANVDYYIVTGLPAVIDGSHIPADSTGTYGFSLDIAAIPVGGPYTVRAKACVTNWGCSIDSAPFEFSRPSLPSSPLGPRLVP